MFSEEEPAVPFPDELTRNVQSNEHSRDLLQTPVVDSEDAKENLFPGVLTDNTTHQSRGSGVDRTVLEDITYLVVEEAARFLDDDFESTEDNGAGSSDHDVLELSFEIYEEIEDEQLAEPGFVSPLGFTGTASVVEGWKAFDPFNQAPLGLPHTAASFHDNRSIFG